MNFTILVADGPTPVLSPEKTARKHFRIALAKASFEPSFMGERGHCYGKYGDLTDDARAELTDKLPAGWTITTYVIPESAISQSRVTHRQVDGRVLNYGGKQ